LEVGRSCEIVGLVVAADQRGHGIAGIWWSGSSSGRSNADSGSSPCGVTLPAQNPIRSMSGWDTPG
jgi:hypothetical protein